METIPTVVLLLGLAACCRALLAVPTLEINLDDEPEVRWLPLRKVFDVDYLNKVAAQIIDSTVPKWVHQAVKPLVKALDKYVPQPYAGEIRGMSTVMGADLANVIMLNFAYEITAFCTSILAQDVNGNVYHGRNLDYPHPVLKNLTTNIVFRKNGKVAYLGTSFAGYVGLWTGQSPYKFTVSGDQRGSEHWWNWWRNFMSAFLFHRSPVSWALRETLEKAEDFQDAVMRLSRTPLIAGVYYIVGGVRPREGVVITRDRVGPVDIWPLEPLTGGWFRVETNFDHWLPAPSGDHRREVANKALEATGQNHINMDSLYQVLSRDPVCNQFTIYTTLMSAASPETYVTNVRPKGCKKTEPRIRQISPSRAFKVHDTNTELM